MRVSSDAEAQRSSAFSLDFDYNLTHMAAAFQMSESGWGVVKCECAVDVHGDVSAAREIDGSFQHFAVARSDAFQRDILGDQIALSEGAGILSAARKRP